MVLETLLGGAAAEGATGMLRAGRSWTPPPPPWMPLVDATLKGKLAIGDGPTRSVD